MTCTNLANKLLLTTVIFLLVSCSSFNASIKNRKGFNRDAKLTYAPTKAEKGKIYFGEVSYYGPGFHGKTTANGETYNQNAMTCAHKTLPFNTKLKITNLANNKSVVLRVNDRGPYKKGRIVDLSVAGAKKIGLIQMGVAKAKVEILQ